MFSGWGKLQAVLLVTSVAPFTSVLLGRPPNIIDRLMRHRHELRGYNSKLNLQATLSLPPTAEQMANDPCVLNSIVSPDSSPDSHWRGGLQFKKKCVPFFFFWRFLLGSVPVLLSINDKTYQNACQNELFRSFNYL